MTEDSSSYLDQIMEIISESDVIPNPPVAEALVPFDPSKWPAYCLGVTASSDPNYGLTESLETVGMNFVELYEYLDECQTTEEWVGRIKTVARDTAIINSGCVFFGDAGAVVGGAYANQRLEDYMTERVLAANSQITIEQEFQIQLTRRMMQSAILETKGMTFEEAEEICNEKGITMDEFLGMEDTKTKVGAFLENADDAEKKRLVDGFLSKVGAVTDKVGIAAGKIIGLCRNIWLGKNMLDMGLIEENLEYEDGNDEPNLGKEDKK